MTNAYKILDNEDIDGEFWKGIEFTMDFYEVSNMGRVRSTNYLIEVNGGSYYNKGGIIKQQLSNCRELTATISCAQLGLSRRPYLVNRLVANAFIDNPYSLPQAIHINGDNLDNRVINLQWATHTENVNKDIAQQRRRASLKIAKAGTMPSDSFLDNHLLGMIRSQETRRRGVELSKNGVTTIFNRVRDAEIYLNCSKGHIHTSIKRNNGIGNINGYKAIFTN